MRRRAQPQQLALQAPAQRHIVAQLLMQGVALGQLGWVVHVLA